MTTPTAGSAALLATHGSPWRGSFAAAETRRDGSDEHRQGAGTCRHATRACSGGLVAGSGLSPESRKGFRGYAVALCQHPPRAQRGHWAAQCSAVPAWHSGATVSPTPFLGFPQLRLMNDSEMMQEAGPASVRAALLKTRPGAFLSHSQHPPSPSVCFRCFRRDYPARCCE